MRSNLVQHDPVPNQTQYLTCSGERHSTGKKKPINLIVAGHKLFKDFTDFISQMEVQFGDSSLKVTAIGKLKTLPQDSSSVDEYILQFKAETSQTDLGNPALVEYLKARLNPVLFKSIYQLPVMPETLKEWYEWAQKLDWKYRHVHFLQLFSDLFRALVTILKGWCLLNDSLNVI